MKTVLAELEERAKRAEQERDQAREALHKYGVHRYDCPASRCLPNCNCGFSEALAAVPPSEDARKLSDLLCPPHANLDAAGQLKPFNNCIACIRNERDELLKAKALCVKCNGLMDPEGRCSQCGEWAVPVGERFNAEDAPPHIPQIFTSWPLISALNGPRG